MVPAWKPTSKLFSRRCLAMWWCSIAKKYWYRRPPTEKNLKL
jgi:hypothetical protein